MSSKYFFCSSVIFDANTSNTSICVFPYLLYSAWIKTTVFDGNEKFNGEYF